MANVPYHSTCVLTQHRGDDSVLPLLTLVLEYTKTTAGALKPSTKVSRTRGSLFYQALWTCSTLLLTYVAPIRDTGQSRRLPGVIRILDTLESFLCVECHAHGNQCPMWKTYEQTYPKCHTFCHLIANGRTDPKVFYPTAPSMRDELLLQLQDEAHNLEYGAEGPDNCGSFADHSRIQRDPLWEIAESAYQASHAISQCQRILTFCSVRQTLESRLMLATYWCPENTHDASVNMLFALNANNPLWDEVRIHVGSQVQPTPPTASSELRGAQKKKASKASTRTERWHTASPKEVPHFCDLLQRPEGHFAIRFNVTLGVDNSVWLHKCTARSMQRKDLTESISLADILATNIGGLNDTAKQMLAVILAYSLFYLYGSPWMGPNERPTWKTENIMFFKKGDRVLLRPFLRAQLYGSSSDTLSDVEAMEEYDDDMIRPDPVLVNFATILLEIHLGMKIELYLKQSHPATDETSRWENAHKVLEDREKYIQGNTYKEVIRACLDATFAEDEDDEMDEIDDDDIKDRERGLADADGCNAEAAPETTPETERRKMQQKIFEKIVGPLHDEFDGQFSAFLDGVDEEAAKMDLVSGLPVIDTRQKTGFNARTLPAQPPSLQFLKTTHGVRMAKKTASFSAPMPVSTCNFAEEESNAKLVAPESAPDSGAQGEVHSLFNNDIFSSTSKDAQSDRWFERFRALPALRPLEMVPPGDQRRVRVAVIDTGIDMSHPTMQAADASGQIITVCDWVNGKKGIEDRATGDACGHGTHVASILLGMAPNVDLYVARVTAGSKMSDSQAANIAEAIHTATKDWKCDIINLSLGFTKPMPAIEAALKQALHEDTLVFSAASNDGGNRGVAYPAMLPRVMCVYSTDGDGNGSPYNPSKSSKLSGPGDYFGIVGESVKGAWPLTLSPKTGPASRRMSGTSVATPVAAAVAACVIGIVRDLKIDTGSWKLKSHEAMSRVFRAMGTERDGLTYLDPVRFLSHGLSELKVDINRALNPSQNDL